MKKFLGLMIMSLFVVGCAGGKERKEYIGIIAAMDEELDAIVKLVDGLDKEIWQYFTVLTNIRSVGTHKGERTYDYTLGIRAVNTVDCATTQLYRFRVNQIRFI
ncbi:GMP synthase (glutamine-hydrolyzing) [Erysipelothrix enhydrae]|uniref:GMP synthase (glutamine-hydrolyzing) n=1 Tax=Erysipelothrix enhydrae TaxID=2890314 RepID=UPI0038B25115